MKDDSSIKHLTAAGDRGVLRRRLLGVTALGLAGALLSPPPLARTAFANDDGARRRRLLLKNGYVLSLDPKIGDLPEGDVLIEGERIRGIGRHINADDAEVIDCSGMIVMPGFIDTHRHMWQGLLRNIGSDDLLNDYLVKILFGHALKMTPGDVYLGDTISALSAMNSGITTIVDWSHIANSRAHTDAAIQALRDVKIRAVYGYGPSFGNPTFWFPPETVNPYPEDIFRLRKQFFSSTDQLLTLALAAAGPEFAGSVDAAAYEWSIARHPDVKARITTHVGVGKGGQFGFLEQLAKKVPLGPDTTYIHCCTLSDTELKLIVDTGGSVSLAIPIEMQMGHGMPPIQRLRDIDPRFRFCLSVDVETNQPSDMFTQMHACFALQRALYIDKNQADCLFQFFVDPAPCRPGILSARDVLELATIEGARANGLLHKTGTLTPGKQADVILLRSNRINVAPLNDQVGAVVLGMDTSNVDSVFIAGNAVKRHGRLVGVDVERILRQAEQAREKLLAR
jgi:5-methylthioadenosine/S-adenosylhomocysteine deaminase